MNHYSAVIEMSSRPPKYIAIAYCYQIEAVYLDLKMRLIIDVNNLLEILFALSSCKRDTLTPPSTEICADTLIDCWRKHIYKEKKQEIETGRKGRNKLRQKIRSLLLGKDVVCLCSRNFSLVNGSVNSWGMIVQYYPQINYLC
jgi:hypothetical protein